MTAVILTATLLLATSWLVAQGPVAQYGHKTTSSKEPRALGLVQIPAKGKARLIPIVIMMDGKFYDAGAYKADPVPMALDFGIVYEGFRSGVSQGIFTISQPGQLNHNWIAEGTWLPAGVKGPEKTKKYTTPVLDDDKDGPPVLHRRPETSDSDSKSQDKDKVKVEDKPKDDQKATTAPAATTAATPAPPAANPGTTTPTSTAPSAPDASKPPAAASAPSDDAKKSQPADDETIADPNRPRLRRGKPDPSQHHEPFTTFDSPAVATAAGGKPNSAAKDPGADAAPVTIIPAISDAGGPEPRPYVYDIKPVEEAIYRNKMFDLAATQLKSQAGAAAKDAAAAHQTVPGKSSGKALSKAAKPSFDEARLRIFDLSNSNEPVLILSAKTHPAAGSSDEPKEITLIARTNLEGDLQKLFFSSTDSRHLDVTPRMELIDAVDADGDGRGELLFRRTSDDGSSYALYRVTADRLWPLFEGTL